MIDDAKKQEWLAALRSGEYEPSLVLPSSGTSLMAVVVADLLAEPSPGNTLLPPPKGSTMKIIVSHIEARYLNLTPSVPSDRYAVDLVQLGSDVTYYVNDFLPKGSRLISVAPAGSSETSNTFLVTVEVPS